VLWTDERLTSGRALLNPRWTTLACLCLLASTPAAFSHTAEPPHFARDVRPILSDACSRCHGPDDKSRAVDLRLDTRDGLFSQRDDGPLIVPGQPEKSLLWLRLTHADPVQRMPPADSGRPLSPAQLETVRQWIVNGARWEDHWAFIPPTRPQVPESHRAGWAHTPIDHFVLASLTDRQLSPQPEADSITLLRRVTLDLTGLPPTPAEVAAWREDQAPDRYARLVDRLLASPRHGEHVAVDWLDAARYADTSGYQSDGPRQMWRWRDWVIDAYNAGKPFDQFTIEQLAGDLLLHERELPQLSGLPTTLALVKQPRGYLPRDRRAADLLIATGFQRNHRGNSEGGIVPEEYAVEYVADRVDTAGAVWLGLTVGCARCHSHKYDPLTQTDYYRLFAYFNQVPEFGRAVKEGNSPPYITAPTADQWTTLAQLEARVQSTTATWHAAQPQLQAAQREWEAQATLPAATDYSRREGLVIQYPAAEPLPNGLPVPQMNTGTAMFSDGPRGPALELAGAQFVDAGAQARFGYFDAFSVTAWVRPTGTRTGGIVSKTSDDAYEDGWAVQLVDGKVQVNLVKRWLDDALRVESVAALPADVWSHVAMTYDGGRIAAGVNVYVNGQLQPLIVHVDLLNQTFTNDEPLRIGATGTRRRFHGGLADVRVYRDTLTEADVATLATRETIPELLAMPAAQRTRAQRDKLTQYYLATQASADVRATAAQHQQAQAALERYRREVLPTVMVMVDQPEPRTTTVLERGAYDRPGRPVTPGVPAALTAATGPVTGNRLDLARWLVHPQHPLTARVAVNTIWQRFFGTGLVKTSEDFGTQGEPPSHPALLDWLARELIDSGWDSRHIERLIVNSAVYRQSSDGSPVHYQQDPQNRWLARGPRVRLSAEMLRDQALSLSGLLEERLGGPSIKPFQPAGLWQEIASETQYEPSPFPEVYRRSLYCYVKRTVANPTFAVFDASTREACLLRRARTNTPLQALTLLNDVTYVAAARALGDTAWEAARPDANAVLADLAERVLRRQLNAGEEQRLRTSWHIYRVEFNAQPASARAWLLAGHSKDTVLEESAIAERAATAAIASVLLNLDEVVTKD
jgi:hypothetical protein